MVHVLKGVFVDYIKRCEIKQVSTRESKDRKEKKLGWVNNQQRRKKYIIPKGERKLSYTSRSI